jgi:hypothetical protein
VAERVTQEDLLEQMKQLRVSDILLDISMSLISLGFLRLGSEARDLGQARLATDALRALVPLLKEHVPEELSRDLGQAVANLQLAYARAVEEQAAQAGEQTAAPEAGTEGETAAEPGPAGEQAAKAREAESA